MAYATGPSRYRLARLSDGRIYAVDNANAGKAYLLTPRPATRARYPLSRGGELLVERGRLTGVFGAAATSGYSVSRTPDGGIRLLSKQKVGQQIVAPRAGGISPAGCFAVLDARDGTLLLLDERGLHELTVQVASPRDAPSGVPIYQYADDFAP